MKYAVQLELHHLHNRQQFVQHHHHRHHHQLVHHNHVTNAQSVLLHTNAAAV